MRARQGIGNVAEIGVWSPLGARLSGPRHDLWTEEYGD